MSDSNYVQTYVAIHRKTARLVLFEYNVFTYLVWDNDVNFLDWDDSDFEILGRL